MRCAVFPGFEERPLTIRQEELTPRPLWKSRNKTLHESESVWEPVTNCHGLNVVLGVFCCFGCLQPMPDSERRQNVGYRDRERPVPSAQAPAASYRSNQKPLTFCIVARVFTPRL